MTLFHDGQRAHEGQPMEVVMKRWQIAAMDTKIADKSAAVAVDTLAFTGRAIVYRLFDVVEDGDAKLVDRIGQQRARSAHAHFGTHLEQPPDV